MLALVQDTNRLRDDIETLRKLLPVVTNAAQFEAGLNVSNTSVAVLPLVNLTVSKLEDVVSDFTELGKTLPPVDTAAIEEEGGTEDKAVTVSGSTSSMTQLGVHLYTRLSTLKFNELLQRIHVCDCCTDSISGRRAYERSFHPIPRD